MDKFPKYIIEIDDELGLCLIMGKVDFHKRLALDKTMVRGGGWFTYNDEDKSFTFWGDSSDFGRASLENVKAAVENDKVFTNRYLTHSIAKDFKFYYGRQSEIVKLN